MKKIISSLLLVLLILQSSSLSYGDYELPDEGLPTSELTYSESLMGEMTAHFGVSKANKIFASVSSIMTKKDDVTLSVLKKRLEVRMAQLKYKSPVFEQKEYTLYLIGNYILLKIDERLQDLNPVESIVSEEITLADKKLVADALTDMEYGVMKMASEFFGNILAILTKGNKQSGSMSLEANINDESIGVIDGVLKLRNYEAKSKVLDSSIKGNLEVILHALATDETTSIDLEMGTFFDFISKGGSDVYFFLDGFSAKYPEENETISSYIDQIKRYVALKKYVKISNPSKSEVQATADIVGFLSGISSIEERKSYAPVFAQSLSIYKKVGSKYYLKKDAQKACEAGQNFALKMWGESLGGCSDVIVDDNTYILDISDDENMAFSVENGVGPTREESTLVFNSQELKSFEVVTHGYAENNHFRYVKGKELSLLINDETNAQIMFTSTLSSTNKFTHIESHINIADAFNMNLSLDNHIIAGDFTAYMPKYDWETNEVKNSTILSGTVAGKTGSKNDLTKLSVVAEGGGMAADTDALKFSFTYEPSSMDINLVYDYAPLFAVHLVHHADMEGTLDTVYKVKQALTIDVDRMGVRVGHIKLTADTKSESSSVNIDAPTEFIDMEDLEEMIEDEDVEEVEEMMDY